MQSQVVDDDVYVVFFEFFQFEFFGFFQFVECVVYLYLCVVFMLQVSEQFFVFVFVFVYCWGEQDGVFVGKVCQQVVGDFVGVLFFDFVFVDGVIWCIDVGVEQVQVVVNFGDGIYCVVWVVVGCFLVDGNGW